MKITIEIEGEANIHELRRILAAAQDPATAARAEPVTSLDLKQRISGRLLEANIRYVSELIELTKREVLEIPRVGSGALWQIKRVPRERGSTSSCPIRPCACGKPRPPRMAHRATFLTELLIYQGQRRMSRGSQWRALGYQPGQFPMDATTRVCMQGADAHAVEDAYFDTTSLLRWAMGRGSPRGRMPNKMSREQLGKEARGGRRCYSAL